MAEPQVTSTFLTAEQAFWDRHGLRPIQHQLNVAGGSVRVQEVGSGDPVIFVHGTGGNGTYFAPAVEHLQDFRCLMLDRPGWTTSTPVSFEEAPYDQRTSELIAGTMDALDLDRANIVGASIGNTWAMHAARLIPDRIGKVVLLGAGPLSDQIGVPTFIKLLRSPVGQVLIRVPEKPGMLRKQLQGLGHASSVASGTIDDGFVNYHVALSNHTDWRRHERAMVKAIVRGNGYTAGVVPSGAQLATIGQPVLMVLGAQEPIGSLDVWEDFVGALPAGQLTMVEPGGHLVWLDDAKGVADRIGRFLS